MKLGEQTWLFENAPIIQTSASVVGPDEGAGPLANDFDIVHSDLYIGEKSWECAERKLLEQAAMLTVQKAGLAIDDVDFFVGGDLMNQIVSATFSARSFGIPYLGVFGACSTSMESLAIASLLVNTGNADRVIAGTTSHNCSVERQFRYPTEYGGQKVETAQNTVTAAGAALVSKTGNGPKITAATIGKVVDMGLKDPNNMGAAMAPAAVDTIMAHLRDRGVSPGYYDLIVTGDLAAYGSQIARELFQKFGVPIEETVYDDCGLMIYDREKQQMFAGASGCGCSAAVTYGHLLKRMERGELKRMLVVATGSLHSPVTYQQKESIPCIAHAVAFESGEVQ
ncbi:stage V sporulation protein AD [Paenibacillus thermotolerans]|uniref:stage V sporulation protein AD n=1 Tax=Paenibacillus thermotolerans TaxID=3027807 RepID=UPI002368572C|nr:MULTISPECIES: stage V sporulation protein AD [unclassified Paenibacillus]